MKKLVLTAMALTAVMALSLTACSFTESGEDRIDLNGTSSSETAADAGAAQESAAEPAADSSEDSVISANALTETNSGSISGMLDTTSLFTNRDLLQTADLTDAKTLTVSDGAALSITEEGVYVLKGSGKDCTVTVNADESAKVQIVLDGVSITNSDFPAIYVISADKVFVTTTDSENSLSVTGSFRADGETNTDAVIFSKSDLVLNGAGKLDVQSASGNGITSKDDLRITGGTYTVSSKLDSFEANDSIAVSGGTFTVDSDKDAFHCENDNAEGTVYIADGSFTLTAESDGIQATDLLQIDGGTFTITSAEGLESTYVQINGGTINISASDDGINAVRMSTKYDTVVEINGGELTIVMGQGDTDAIDANGSIYVNGGTINITAPTSSFDYDAEAQLNGGTVIINGEQVNEIPQSMMGGPGGMGGHGGFGGGMGRPDGEGGMGGFGRPEDMEGFEDGGMPFPGEGGESGEFGGFGGGRGGRGGKGGFRQSGTQDSATSAFTDAALGSAAEHGEI